MSTYELEKRVSFITNTLGFTEEEAQTLSMKAFCKEYGEQADHKDHNKKVIEKIKKKYRNYGFSILSFKWEKIADELSNKSGVYAIYGLDAERGYDEKFKCILYIGKSTNLLYRIPSSIHALRTKECVLVTGAKYLIVENESDMDLLEVLYIQKYKPIYNRDCKRKSNSMFAAILDQYIDISSFSDVPR